MLNDGRGNGAVCAFWNIPLPEPYQQLDMSPFPFLQLHKQRAKVFRRMWTVNETQPEVPIAGMSIIFEAEITDSARGVCW